MKGRAKKGGETAVNGEFYEGGQFLPASATTRKGEYKAVIRKGTRRLIEPYISQPSPDEDMLSIFDRINPFCHDNRKACTWAPEGGFVGFAFTGPHEFMESVRGREPMPEDWRAWLETMIARFNAGERWFHVSDDPFHYRNLPRIS